MDLETVITGIGGVIAAVSAWFWSAKKTTKDLRAQDLANDTTAISNANAAIDLYKKVVEDIKNEWESLKADNRGLDETLKRCEESHEKCERQHAETKQELMKLRIDLTIIERKINETPLNP